MSVAFVAVRPTISHRLLAAEALREKGDLSAAQAAWREVLDVDPGRVEALVALGASLLADGQTAESVRLLRRATRAAPNHAEPWDALGRALSVAGCLDEAVESLSEAWRLSPDDAGIGIRAAAAAHASLRGDRWLDWLAGDPRPAAIATRGTLLAASGRLSEAADALVAADTLGCACVNTLSALGGVLARLGEAARAEPVLGRAIAMAPASDDLALMYATTLLRLHRHRAAASVLLESLARGVPDTTASQFLGNLAGAATALGQQDDALDHARAAVKADPSSMAAHRAVLNARPYCAGTTAADMAEAARACASTIEAPDPPPFMNGRDPERPLRVGLLSGGLRTHPVGWLTVAGLEALDPALFTIVAFVQECGAASNGDSIAGRFRARATGGWHATDALDDASVAALIRAEAIDVLIDLGGHGDHGRVAVCAHRAAPVQIKWVGMQSHSTGLSAMDGFITDIRQSPQGIDWSHTERLIRMPDGYVCYTPPPYAPAVSPLPALDRTHVTFGCFNNLAKITPPTFTAWAAILRATPKAHLVLKTHQLDDAETVADIHERFVERGIDPLRISCLGAGAHRTHLASYGLIDVALDPFPYVGGLTTVEALWMGVPTITLAGDYFAARHSAGHLGNVGLDDWVTETVDDYIKRAVAAAADVKGLAALRAGLRARVAASPLCDAPRFGAALGNALRTAWARWCAGGVP